MDPTRRPSPVHRSPAPPGGERRAAPLTGAGRRSGWAVTAVFVAHGMLFASWTPHIPVVQRHLGLAVGGLGLALVAAPAGSVLATALVGAALPRLGSRACVRAGLLATAALGPLVGDVRTLPGFLAAFAGWGAALGMLDVAMNAQGVTVERRAGRPMMPGFHGGWSVGALLGVALGTAAVAAGVSLGRQALVLGTLLVVVVGWASTRLLPDHRPGRAAGPGSGPGPTPAGRADGLLQVGVLVLGTVAFADMLCEGAAADWAAVVLHDSLRVPAGLAGLGYTGYALTMAAVRLAGNRLVGRWRPSRLVPALAATAAAVLAAGLAIDTAAAVAVGFAALGVGLALVAPTVLRAAGNLPDVHPSRAVAAVSTCAWIGLVTGPPLIGALASVVGLHVALLTVPALATVVAAGIWGSEAARRGDYRSAREPLTEARAGRP